MNIYSGKLFGNILTMNTNIIFTVLNQMEGKKYIQANTFETFEYNSNITNVFLSNPYQSILRLF